MCFCLLVQWEIFRKLFYRVSNARGSVRGFNAGCKNGRYACDMSRCRWNTARAHAKRLVELGSQTAALAISELRHTSPPTCRLLEVFFYFLLEGVVRYAALDRYSEFGGCSIFGSSKCITSMGIALIRYSGRGRKARRQQQQDTLPWLRANLVEPRLLLGEKLVYM